MYLVLGIDVAGNGEIILLTQTKFASKQVAEIYANGVSEWYRPFVVREI